MKPEPSLPVTLQSPPIAVPDGKDYRIVSTGCQYCVVGCGYEAHVWKLGTGVNAAPALEQGHWVSPAMTEKIYLDGEERIAAILPDPKCPLNRGNHSSRGGTQGRDLMGPADMADGKTRRARDSVRERITSAYVRTQNGSENGYEPISTDLAIKIVAQLAAAATAKTDDVENKLVRFQKPQGLGVKLFEYQYLENTYIATKLFYQLIGTPNVAFHDRPSVASNTEGFNDSGVDPHGYAYEDVWDSDVIFLIGINPYESQSVFFMQAIAGKRLIVLDPRRTITADYAEKTGGLHLQPTKLGADVAVLNALCRHIRDKRRGADGAQWERDWKRAGLFNPNAGKAVTPNPNNGPQDERRAYFQMTPDAFEKWLDESGQPTIAEAATLSGIPIAALERAARWLSGPPELSAEIEKTSKTRKVSIIFEKGVIWGFSYHGTAAVANLGLYLGSVMDLADASGNQPTPNFGVTGRAGGHQKGWCETRYHVRPVGNNDPKFQLRDQGYPFLNASDAFLGEDGKDLWRTHHYLDPHIVGSGIAKVHPRAKSATNPDVKLLWLIGSNAAGQMGNAHAKWEEIARRRGTRQPTTAEETDVVKTLRERMEKGGLVIVQQDIYPNPTTAHADIILPASGWGEHDFTRFNGERRLRVYGRFQDPPKRDGESKSRCLPDWEIFRQVAMQLIPVGWSGHGLPDSWEFSNGDKIQTTAVPPLKHDDFAHFTKTSQIFAELATDGRSNQSSLLKNIVTKADGWVELQALGSRGVVLPALRDKDGKLADSLRKPVKNDSGGNPPYSFLRASWSDISDEFEQMQPRAAKNEVAVCNGRINELWNSLFTHIRNETVRHRYPDDAPGTILEVGASDAQRFKLENGDVIELSCDDIRYGTMPGAFTAVVVIQPGVLPEGVVFAYFSWPAHTRKLNAFPYRQFNTVGYVNNLTSGWTDPVNPIAAVKYARATIKKTGRRFDLPSYAARSIAFEHRMVSDESKRLHWEVRELIVQRALPAVKLHDGIVPAEITDGMRQPDVFMALLEGKDAAWREGFVQAAERDRMKWDYFELPGLSDEQQRRIAFDAKWSAKEKALVRLWKNSIDGPPPPASPIT